MSIKKFDQYQKINESSPNPEIQSAYSKTEDFKKYREQIRKILDEAEQSFDKFLQDEYDTDIEGKDEYWTWNLVVQDLTGLGEDY